MQQGSRPITVRTVTACLMIILLATPFLVPIIWRLCQSGLNEPAGLLSDLAIGWCLFAVAWWLPRLPRAVLLVCFAVFQIIAFELHGAVHRLPSWQDARYLFDTTFLMGSLDGFHLSRPLFVTLLSLSGVTALLLPLRRCRPTTAIAILASGLLLFVAHSRVARISGSIEIAGRYQALHWLVSDAVAGLRRTLPADQQPMPLPAGLVRADLDGTTLLPADQTTRQQTNVLLVVLEGIPGLYLEEIATRMGVSAAASTMPKLAAATGDAMLIPDFVVHSHQTIRGLYAIHCGDFSKFSFATPKAFELEAMPERARQCLPAQLAEHGWETHYLQGAPLPFMNKDRAMPVMGFAEVHGLEWFDERTTTDFIWGTSDTDFFRGATRYVRSLQQSERPWFLSLLTVGTHQPYAVTEAAAKQYGSRRAAAVALLDEAVGRFLDDLRHNGVLDDTLVIITSDESHGAAGADWYTSWGLALIIAPERQALPRIKDGTYGLVDLEVSILDYLHLPVPPDIVGRSMLRDYDRGREMISFTGGLLRWQTADNHLYECGRSSTCRVVEGAGIIGFRPEPPTEEPVAAQRFALAGRLDANLAGGPLRTLHFADGQIRRLPPVAVNDWTDNLIGAQYLDFPAQSQVEVDIALQAVAAPPSGIQLRLVLRQFEQEVSAITPPDFPILYDGQAHQMSFRFTNEEARQAFSFHLLGAAPDTEIRIDRFAVTIDRDG